MSARLVPSVLACGGLLAVLLAAHSARPDPAGDPGHRIWADRAAASWVAARGAGPAPITDLPAATVGSTAVAAHPADTVPPVTAASTPAAAGPAAGTDDTAPPGGGVEDSRKWNLLGLGDSVLTHCRCPGVLRDYADLVTERTGDQVRAENTAAPGARSSDVLWALNHMRRLRSAVATADAVVLFVGANNFEDVFDAVADGRSPTLFDAAAEHLRTDMSKILAVVAQLHGPGIPVLVCGYWNDFKDGAVARQEYSPTRRRAAAAATVATNSALQQAAQAAGAIWVPTTAAVADPDRSGALDPDGNHLSAAGARLVAAALLAARPPT